MGWFRRARGDGRAQAGSADAALRRALLAHLARDVETAVETLERAARAHPQDVDVYRALALLYGQQGDFGRSIRMHQTLLLRRDLPEAVRVEVLGELAEDFRRAGFLRRAAAAYEEVLVHEPRHRRALSGLARLLRSLRDPGRALVLLRRLRRSEGRGPGAEESEARLEEAEAAHAEGRSDDARRLLRRARRRDRDHAPTLVLLGTVEAERGRNAAALRAWQEAVRADPRCGPIVYPRLEAAFASAGRTREFEAYLRALLAERPDDAAARLALSRALAAWGEVDAAVAELRTVIDAGGPGALPRAALVRVLLDAKREGEALAELAPLLDAVERDAASRPETSA